MGLAQKRIMAEYQKDEYPKWKAQLDAAAGFDVPLEVKWDTLPNDDYEDKKMCFESFDKVYFRPLLTMIKNICVDDMGKTTFREHMKKITVDGSDGHSSSFTTFENGHLLIKHKAFTNVDQEEQRSAGWQKMIEQKL